jgi:hypothetical protein
VTKIARGKSVKSFKFKFAGEKFNTYMEKEMLKFLESAFQKSFPLVVLQLYFIVSGERVHFLCTRLSKSEERRVCLFTVIAKRSAILTEYVSGGVTD